MGLFKRCKHSGRNRDRCEHAWWGSFQHLGSLHRASLAKWANGDIKTKQQAQVVYERFRQAVRDGRVSSAENRNDDPITFDQLADLYTERYVVANDLASADTIQNRLKLLREHFGPKRLTDIRTADVEDFIAKLKQPTLFVKDQRIHRVRRPATINRYLSMLGHMFNWAIGREYLERTPFRRGTQVLIRHEQEDNLRHRRFSTDEETLLLDAASNSLRPLIVIALDAGLRRGEMLAMTWADVDARPGWMRLRGETTKSGRTRWVPIATTRLHATLDFLRLDASGLQKPANVPVCSNEAGEPTLFPRAAWHAAILRAHGFEPKHVGGRKGGGRLTDECRGALRQINLHWHDLRHHAARRIMPRPPPLRGAIRVTSLDADLPRSA
jgi:integrase